MIKTITKYGVGFALLSLLMLSACQKEGDLDYTERKLVGTWHYEDASMNTGIFSSEDLMDEYDADELILNNDFTAVHFDDETQVRSSGTWEKSQQQVDGCYTTVLTVNLTRSTTNENYILEFHHLVVSKFQFSGNAETSSGKADFELCKD
jgi:hypothetical protein